MKPLSLSSPCIFLFGSRRKEMNDDTPWESHGPLTKIPADRQQLKFSFYLPSLGFIFAAFNQEICRGLVKTAQTAQNIFEVSLNLSSNTDEGGLKGQ